MRKIIACVAIGSRKYSDGVMRLHYAVPRRQTRKARRRR
jgi:hypothetical protein